MEESLTVSDKLDSLRSTACSLLESLDVGQIRAVRRGEGGMHSGLAVFSLNQTGWGRLNTLRFRTSCGYVLL